MSNFYQRCCRTLSNFLLLSENLHCKENKLWKIHFSAYLNKSYINIFVKFQHILAMFLLEKMKFFNKEKNPHFLLLGTFLLRWSWFDKILLLLLERSIYPENIHIHVNINIYDNSEKKFTAWVLIISVQNAHGFSEKRK